MTDAPVKTQRLTMDEFIRLYDEFGGIELIDGQIIKLSPTLSGHNLKIRTLFRALDTFVSINRLGEVFSEATFVLPDLPESHWVTGSRQPDVLFVTSEKYEAFINLPDIESKPFRFIPDLVIEVISPSDRYSDVNRKIIAYLNDGVRLIWIVDTELKVITVCTQDKPQVTITINDTLSGGDALPQLEMPVSQIFALV